MATDTAIEVSEVWKRYRLGQFGARSVRDDFVRRLSPGRRNASSDYFWALRNVSFAVEKSDIVGLVGPNGAGKSTLLKVLSQVTTPTRGVVRGRGRVSSLLEVGTGFHPELTGRENIFLNGAIMGMRKAEIGRKVDDIIDFSGCGRHIDTPVKRYSSGMVVRLGFSVAAHLDCEIMIVDEVLAVGDQAFRSQAVEKMKSVSLESGRTILFVSHNLSTVAEFCQSGLVLNSGTLTQYNTIAAAINSYIAFDRSDDTLERRFDQEDRPKITAIRVTPDSIRNGHLALELEFSSPYEIAPAPGIVLYGDNYAPLFGTNIRMHQPSRDLDKATNAVLRCDIRELPLHEGRYRISAWLDDGETNVDFVEHALDFEFVPKRQLTTKPPIANIGPLNVEGSWSALASNPTKPNPNV